VLRWPGVPYDAILIPGGGLRDGAVPDWVAARFDRALSIGGDPLLIALSAGTPHRPPPLDSRGFPITEARGGAAYLVGRGVDPRRILLEECSHDTIGNAYFSRVVHAIPRGLRRVLVITSEFHMPRTAAAFEWIYRLQAPGPSCSLDFESVPDVGIASDSLSARLAKEAAGLDGLRALARRIDTLASLHEWLFTGHGAYAPGPRTHAGAVDPATY
jgi:hypothetical protein